MCSVVRGLAYASEGCGFDCRLGHMQEAANQCYFLTLMFLSSFLLSLFPPLSLDSMREGGEGGHMSSGEGLKQMKNKTKSRLFWWKWVWKTQRSASRISPKAVPYPRPLNTPLHASNTPSHPTSAPAYQLHKLEFENQKL